jgi:hypothetical protein
MKKAIVTLVTTLAAVSSCATPIEQFRKDSLSRAAFELNCPAEKLEVTQVSGTSAIGTLNKIGSWGMGGGGESVAVSGCNQRALYTRTSLGDWTKSSVEKVAP